MLQRLIWGLSLSLLLFGTHASAQGEAYTPEQGSAERRSIADALRVPVQKQLKKKVIFKIDHLKVQDGWAFLLAEPQQPDGSAMDYRGTRYQQAIDAGMFDNGISALLRKRGGKWHVVTYALGSTDVPYVEWDKKYKAPSEIFKQQ